MNLAEFLDLLDARGGDLSAWPDADRVRGEHLLAANPQARAALAKARSLEDLIARTIKAEGMAVDAAVVRIRQAFARELPPQRRYRLAWPAALLGVDLAPARLRIAVLLVGACLGLALGLFGPDLGSSDAGTVIASTSAETSVAAMFEPEPLTGARP
jgi:hypothetical protein